MAINQALISATTISAPVSSVTIPVPSGYTDLRIVASLRGTDNASGNPDVGGFFQLNSTSSGYVTRDLYANASGVYSSTNPYNVTSSGYIGAVNSNSTTAGSFTSKEIYIPSYSSSGTKSVVIDSVQETNATPVYSEVLSSYVNSGAVTSITFTVNAGNFATGSAFTLYGISSAGASVVGLPKATGGDIVKNDGTYWYHAFLSTGAFIPQTSLTADVLVVAGAGGGGCDIGGAGGAGGLLPYTSQALSASNYTVSIGAGGSGGTSAGIRGANGTSSSFGALTAPVGGGGGGGYNSGDNGFSGGSGGGGGHNSTTGGSGTAGQGYAGGRGNAAGSSGGGGGATAIGTDAGSTSAGNGGAGTNAYSSWLSATSLGVSGYLAGGGGGAKYNGSSGGTGGAGGGGNGGVYGGSPQNGTAGTANTGSGGGGGSPYSGQGGNGGSGVVIIRYAMA